MPATVLKQPAHRYSIAVATGNGLAVKMLGKAGLNLKPQKYARNQ
jgi:hypothetical protein